MTFNKIYQLSESDEQLNAHRMNQEQLDKYNASMEKGLLDKMFFNEHIPHYDLLVDFGCANGALIKAAYPYDSEATYIGYDISDQMLGEASSNVGKKANIIWTSDFGVVQKAVNQCNKAGKISLLVLNSVLHEVYSYSGPKEYRHFWSQAFRTGFTYISVRDMMMRQKNYDKKIPQSDLETILDKMMTLDHGEEKVSSFEDIYGEINSEGKLIHLLLKWNFWSNWDREVHEHYLGIYIDEFFKKMNKVSNRVYKPVHYNEFVLSYLRNWVKEQIGYEIKSPTHVKILLKAES
jgi:hypothetical protein